MAQKANKKHGKASFGENICKYGSFVVHLPNKFGDMKKMFVLALMVVVMVLNYVRACLRSANLKRALVCSCLLAALQMQAQVVYGDKQGWEAYTTEDEYTGKKSHYMQYFDDRQRLAASFFPGSNRMAVLEWYDGVLFMDETLEAVTEHHGEFPDRQVDYEWRVTLPKDDSTEDFGTVKMTFGDVERAGDTFFGTFVFDADRDAMMAGKWIAVRWNDPLRQEQVVKRISLAGFTRCYDEVLRRYGVKRKK